MANFGAGAPTIVALHLEHSSRTLVALASVLSMVFAVALVRGASALMPDAA
jgi:hypothetical protein